MAPAVPIAITSTSKGVLTWRPTKIMNMRDLSKDDDFLSHLLVEKLGTGTVPLLVHKMDPSRRLPKTDAQDLLTIVRRLVVAKGPVQHSIRQAVDELLLLASIRYYLKSYTQKQINAFATHASRYFELYNPLGFIEIAHTSRYSHRTGKSELCILATRNLPPGTVITELKGSMANLTDEEDKELKRTDLRNSDIRRDFSVIHSKQMKKNHLFLGPARFVNHDCDNNCELFREGKYITFRTLRAISIGMEITAHYGDGYFGRKNRHCLCETCEKRGRGGYAPESAEDDPQPDSGSDSDSDSNSDTSSSDSDTEVDEALPKPNLNVNERRTRRGVYAILTKKDDDSDESDEEEDNTIPLADAQDIPADGEIELTTELDTPSDLASLGASVGPESTHAATSSPAIVTPMPDSRLQSCSSLSSLSSMGDLQSTPKRNDQRQFRSIISTRRQKARESLVTQQLVTPPLSEDAVSLPETTQGTSKRVTRSVSSVFPSRRSEGKGKGKEKDNTPTPTRSRKMTGKDEVKIKKEETEPRALRGRPLTANIPEPSKDPPAEREIPRGPDGKPLPTCVTCSSILPVISVDSKVIWGLGVEGSPKKKKAKQECPRCMRHAAIYGQPWPSRIPLHGIGFLPTPREEATPTESASSKRMTQKALSVLDRKLAAAASASAKSRKRDDNSSDRPTKRRKVESISQGETSTKAAKVIVKGAWKKRHSLPAPPPGERRKRGRPRLSSPRRVIKVEEIPADDGEVMPQPRNTNGRFEKKVRSLKKSASAAALTRVVANRAERAIEREKVKAGNDDDENEERGSGTWTSPRRKRPFDGDFQFEELPVKRAHQRRTDPPKKVLPRSVSHFRGGKLFSNPNPLSFALRAWAGPMILDESSEDEKVPVTPEDVQSLPPTIVEADTTELPISSIMLPPSVPRGALTFKPSPSNFAKRRWVSSSASCYDGKSADGQGRQYLTARPDELIPDSDLPMAGRKRPRTQFSQAYSSDDESHVDLSEPVGRLTPVLDGYAPSAISPNDQHPAILRHSYPTLSSNQATLYPTVTSFTSDEPGPAPNLINAGWDSCSEISDL